MTESERGETAWPWPDDLDGPIAAPENHVAIFENDEVRVLDVRIAVGETAPLHTHQRPTIMYIRSGSHFIRRDETGAVLFDSRAVEPPFEMPRVQWSSSTPAHTLENTGDEDFVLIAVELKT
jgi:mannose-6-phosphate isomerase-like protein (cupin superfamily)